MRSMRLRVRKTRLLKNFALPHRGAGFMASVIKGKGVVFVDMKRGDGTVVEVGHH